MSNDDLLKRTPLLVHGDEELAQIAAAVCFHEDSEMQSFSPSWKRCLPHICIASIGAFLFGYHSGVLNASLLFVAQDLGFSDNVLAQGWVVSICLIGALLGCFSSGSVTDELGRRRAAQISTVPVMIGGTLSAVAPSLRYMMAGRFLVGIGLGVGAPAAALYVSEISPAQYRGTFSALCQISSCLGLLGALVVGLPVATVPGWWRVCFWISAVPAAILILGLELCSESPRWLFKRSKWYEAEVAIKRLWGASNLEAAVADIIRCESGKELEQASYSELFSRRYVKVVFTGAAVFAFQQFAGINAIFYFSSTFFRNAGVTSELVASVCVGFVNLFASCLAACLMDTIGRRTLLMWSFFGMSIGMAIQVLGVVIPSLAEAEGYISLCGTLFYVLMFAIGVGPVPLALLPEIFPSRIRAKAMAVSMSVHWMGSFIVGLMFLPLLKMFGAPFLYASFATICLLGVAFVRNCVLETKGKTLEEIEALMMNHDQHDEKLDPSLKHMSSLIIV